MSCLTTADETLEGDGEGEGIIAIHVQHMNEPHGIKGNGTQQW